jgi:hypothetical protein
MSDFSSESASIGTLQSDVTEVLTRSKTRRAINAGAFDAGLIIFNDISFLNAKLISFFDTL